MTTSKSIPPAATSCKHRAFPRYFQMDCEWRMPRSTTQVSCSGIPLASRMSHLQQISPSGAAAADKMSKLVVTGREAAYCKKWRVGSVLMSLGFDVWKDIFYVVECTMTIQFILFISPLTRCLQVGTRGWKLAHHGPSILEVATPLTPFNINYSNLLDNSGTWNPISGPFPVYEGRLLCSWTYDDHSILLACDLSIHALKSSHWHCLSLTNDREKNYFPVFSLLFSRWLANPTLMMCFTMWKAGTLHKIARVTNPCLVFPPTNPRRLTKPGNQDYRPVPNALRHCLRSTCLSLPARHAPPHVGFSCIYDTYLLLFVVRVAGVIKSSLNNHLHLITLT